MILEYIDAAMLTAKYELLPDDGLYYGEIPGFDGVYASAVQLEDCQHELKATLEDWLLISLRKNLPTPVINGISLEVKNVA
ncbi:MAG TPA: hypothetical protein VEY32_01560 [Flavisolibacter sp.]|jgi:predicted RNase H-like HicB family nuclease|nr:hypothetical protein [Flavisolibacter sp.]